ncbi:hypothetical protein [Duganella radicis]|uniref:Flagellar FliJ protein n=1 Tax=Duganella radicis TaxID=551988 RepID=A0A6L6PRQ3_9BURK|nr:hypothetical protein [Duganella radicis]MTV41459.1 hypothetical protein [Duganella radicis]
MAAGRFRYALEPIASQRQWALDAVLLELSEHNFTLARRQEELAALVDRMAQATAALRAQAESGAMLQVERHGLWLRYLSDQHGQVRGLERIIADLLEERDGIIDKVASAQRAVDAMREHRDEMRQAFSKARASAELKEVDDQWNVLQAVRGTDGD